MRNKTLSEMYGYQTCTSDEEEGEWNGEIWDASQVEDYMEEVGGRCAVLVDGYIVDVTSYLADHVSCISLLQQNCQFVDRGTACLAAWGSGDIASPLRA
jgi:hypothetical protein